MSNFSVYFSLGLGHILNWAALDHLLFILSLTCIYVVTDYKKLLWLVTAFTLGHSITLALATLKLVEVNTTWVEFLIPCTILFSAIFNLVKTKKRYRYWLVAVFGLIHGLGFSNYFKSILGGDAASKVLPLAEFALGIEAAQMIVVFVLLVLSYIVQTVFRFSKRDWTLVMSSFVIGVVLPIRHFKEWSVIMYHHKKTFKDK